MAKPKSRAKRSVSGGNGTNDVRRTPGNAIRAYRELMHEQQPGRFPPPSAPTVHEVVTLDQRRPGQPPSLVQRACRLEFEKRIPMLCRIADGDECRVYEVLSHTGEVVPMMVQPTIVERLKAMELLARVGQLYQVTPDAGADPPSTGRLNLGALSQKELEVLERILKVATATPVPFTTEATT